MIIDLMDYFGKLKDIKTGNIFKIPLEEFNKWQKNYKSCQKRYVIVLCRFLLQHSYTWEGIIGCLLGTKHEDIGKLIWFEQIAPHLAGGLSAILFININYFYKGNLPRFIPSLPAQCELILLMLCISLKNYILLSFLLLQ